MVEIVVAVAAVVARVQGVADLVVVMGTPLAVFSGDVRVVITVDGDGVGVGVGAG